MRSGRRVAVDVGTVRIGIAVSDVEGILASPLKTLLRTSSTQESVRNLLGEISDYEPIEFYVGLPIALSGNVTKSTEDALSFASEISKQSNVPVRLIDERLTTNSSSKTLREVGKNVKDGRKIIDQIAATIILEQALLTEKNSGLAPGTAIEEFND